ncbi:Mu DNA-binding domain [Klebsiella pneumoniae]|uniref:Mu DNA-binding domain n=1 Tax=Klebsiella pneumoniae TaxID=573 RepID=A0A2X3IWA9_KLEPN|nr:Mu DNA-binding domain [Klebsiella pneumoniae]
MFVTVNELIGIPGLPSTVQGLRLTLNKRASGSPELVRKREGSKAFEYHVDCLPEEARRTFMERHYRQLLNNRDNGKERPVSARAESSRKSDELQLIRQCPALLEREVGSLTTKQKEIAHARATLALYIEKLRDAGMSRTAAVNFVSVGSRKGSLPEHLMKAAELANARKGNQPRRSRYP